MYDSMSDKVKIDGGVTFRTERNIRASSLNQECQHLTRFNAIVVSTLGEPDGTWVGCKWES